MKIAVSEFVKRQTHDSKFSYFGGTWDELLKMVEANFDKRVAGYRDGVALVPVSPTNFFAGTVKATAETKFKVKFEARREGEAPYIQVLAEGAKKTPAKRAEIVLYRHDVLMEGNEASSDADWEIICVLAYPTEDEEPMSPLTMARNFLKLPGGTKGEYTAEQFATAIVYWSDKVHCG
ncbi:MAG TPA: DUF3228 family protein [Planctomycetota bacterium]|jgi:hypothetical protein